MLELKVQLFFLIALWNVLREYPCLSLLHSALPWIEQELAGTQYPLGVLSVLACLLKDHLTY